MATVHRLLTVALLAGSVVGCAEEATGPTPAVSTADAPARQRGPATTARVLVFTATAGFRHDSIDDAAAWFGGLDGHDGLSVTVTDGTLTADLLDAHDVAVFVSTTGDVLDAGEQAALEAWVEGGGGWLGVHGAADAHYGWPWWGDLVGAWFAGHPAPQAGTVEVVDAAHPATAGWPARAERTEEWYSFDRDPAEAVGADVLFALDETTVADLAGDAGAALRMVPEHGHHPIAWTHTVGAGRAVYTALGHAPETWADQRFRDHLLGAVRWLAAP